MATTAGSVVPPKSRSDASGGAAAPRVRASRRARSPGDHASSAGDRAYFAVVCIGLVGGVAGAVACDGAFSPVPRELQASRGSGGFWLFRSGLNR